jgi:hypothetical protein
VELPAIGIDLGETVFHLVGVDASGVVVVRKKCSRSQLLVYTANVRLERIGMEACSGRIFLAALRGEAMLPISKKHRLWQTQWSLSDSCEKISLGSVLPMSGRSFHPEWYIRWHGFASRCLQTAPVEQLGARARRSHSVETELLKRAGISP